MRVPRVRFTVRRMMVSVAVVAMGLGANAQLARWRELARLYEIKAEAYDGDVWRERAGMSREGWAAYRRWVDEANRKGGRKLGRVYLTYLYGPDPAQARRLADHEARLREKYLRAAAQPWWPVEADPSMPK